MARPNVLIICLISAYAYHFVHSSEEFGSSYDVNFVKNFTKTLNANPGIKLKPSFKGIKFDPLSKKWQITHTWGSRTGGE